MTTQFIHVDSEARQSHLWKHHRARVSTLLCYRDGLSDAVDEGVTMGVNYGMNKIGLSRR